MLTLEQLRDEALGLLAEVPDGPLPEPVLEHLIAFAVRISVTTLDRDAAAAAAADAQRAGASLAQLREAAFLVSALGVHSLFVGLPLLADPAPAAPDAERLALWERWVGGDKYWNGFEREFPGALQHLLQASPEGFDAFFRFCALPWHSATLPPLTKELIAMACDAVPTHRYLPGLRLHLRNALKLGAGKALVLRALDIAAAAPAHRGAA